MNQDISMILTFQKRIQQAIHLGESHFREFKSALEQKPEGTLRRDAKLIAKDIGETLVAFANADGGELLVGVEDDGHVTGVPHIREHLVTIQKAVITHIHPDTPLVNPEVRTLDVSTIPGSKIIYFSVQKGTEVVHLTSDGRCLQRRDRENKPVSVETIQKKRHEIAAMEYDREMIMNAEVSDLDLNMIASLAKNLMPGTSPELFLQYLNLAEFTPNGIKLKRAALLLFAKDISKWHPRSQVRVIRVVGTSIGSGAQYEVEKDEIRSGNIMDLLTLSWDILRPNLAVTKLQKDITFRETLLYPEMACREALTNAIAHRDYSTQGKGIEIFVFDNRIEILSPGRLLSTIKIDDLKSLKRVHESRNPHISRVLREIGLMRELGEGIPRIFRAMAEYDLVQPELVEIGDGFKITLYSKSIFSERDQAWLGGYSFLDISKDEQKILLLGRDGKLMTANQIIDILKIVDIDDYRKVLESLQYKGLVYSKLTDPQVQNYRKKYGGNRREVPRFLIRSATELEQYYKELTENLKNLKDKGKMDNITASSLGKSLTLGNPFKTNILKTLQYLGFISVDKTPLPKMLKL